MNSKVIECVRAIYRASRIVSTRVLGVAGSCWGVADRSWRRVLAQGDRRRGVSSSKVTLKGSWRSRVGTCRRPRRGGAYLCRIPARIDAAGCFTACLGMTDTYCVLTAYVTWGERNFDLLPSLAASGEVVGFSGSNLDSK